MTPRYSLLKTEEKSALYELFIFAEQADGRISLSEQETVLMLLDAMGFTSDYARDFYEDTVQTRVSAIASTPAVRSERLAELCGRFTSLESRRLADLALANLAAADGSQNDPAESALLTEIRGLLRV